MNLTFAQLALKAQDSAVVPFVDAVVVNVAGQDQDLGKLTRGFWVGGTGDLAVLMASGKRVTFLSLPAGTLLPIAASKVFDTGTDATEIVALF